MFDLYKIRKDLHKIPELGFQEFKTQEYLLKQLKKLSGLNIHTFDNHTGIVVEYSHGKDDFTLFRADIDALPITEKTGVDFTSHHSGKMHACGHDIHMTILLGLIEKVVNSKVKKNLLFVFQPAEEGQGGALKILETDILKQRKISACYALHVNGSLSTGTVSTKPGIFFGIPQEFDVIFHGKSSHTAFPEEGRDSLIAANHFYQIMNSHLSLSFSPTDSVIFRVGEMHAGTVQNAIPKTTIMKGTTRTFTKGNRDKLNNLIKLTADNIADIFDMKAEVVFRGSYDPVINSEELYRKLKSNLPKEIDFEEAKVVMTGEDFGFFTTKYEGLLFWLGASSNGEGLHSDKFLPDEKAIDFGIEVFYNLI